MKIIEFGRPECRTVREAVREALKSVEEEFEVDIEFGNGRFSSGSFGFKIDINTRDENGEKQNAKEKEFKLYAKSFGLEPDDFGKTFNDRGKLYTIVGIKPRSYKVPVLAKNLKGKVYKFPADVIIRGLGRTVKDGEEFQSWEARM